MNASVGTIVSASRVETQVNRRTVPITRASLSALAVMAVVCAPVAPASAGGFYVQEQSKRGAGRAFSGEAARNRRGRAVVESRLDRAQRTRSGRGRHRARFPHLRRGRRLHITRPIPPAGLDDAGGRPLAHRGGSRDDFLPMGAFATPVGRPLLSGAFR
jgi:long-chain fatty acid transport protein